MPRLLRIFSLSLRNPESSVILLKMKPRSITALVAIMILPGCEWNDLFSQMPIDVTVADSREVQAVTSNICGREIEFHRVGSQFNGNAYIDCEGGADIFVRFRDGAVARCETTYFTGHMVEAQRFTVQGSDCRRENL